MLFIFMLIFSLCIDRLKSNQSGIISITAVNLVIRACGRSSRPDIAVQILNDMTSKYGVFPDVTSYRYGKFFVRVFDDVY